MYLTPECQPRIKRTVADGETITDGSVVKGDQKIIVYNPQKATIKKIVVNVYNLTGYDATQNGKAVPEGLREARP